MSHLFTYNLIVFTKLFKLSAYQIIFEKYLLATTGTDKNGVQN